MVLHIQNYIAEGYRSSIACVAEPGGLGDFISYYAIGSCHKVRNKGGGGCERAITSSNGKMLGQQNHLMP